MIKGMKRKTRLFYKKNMKRYERRNLRDLKQSNSIVIEGLPLKYWKEKYENGEIDDEEYGKYIRIASLREDDNKFIEEVNIIWGLLERINYGKEE